MPDDFTEFRRRFYAAVLDRPLTPEDPLYVPIYEGRFADPIKLLAERILLAPERSSSHLLAGYRGSGKSTELRRLRRHLEDEGYLVLLIDLDDYLNPSSPIDITDFLLVLSLALDEAAAPYLPAQTKAGALWERLVTYLKEASPSFEEASFGVNVGVQASIKANIKKDPSFQRRLQEVLSGHVARLAEEVQRHVEEIARHLQAASSVGKAVLLIDSVEHLVDTTVSHKAVQDSVQVVFVQHASRLRLPELHTVLCGPAPFAYSGPRLPYDSVRRPLHTDRYSSTEPTVDIIG